MNDFDGDGTGSNPTSNPLLSEMIGVRVGRRALLGGGLATAAAFVAGRPAFALTQPTTRAGRGRIQEECPLLGFTEVPVSTDDTFVVPDGYHAQVLIPWGTPLTRSGPAWRPDAGNTAAEQAQQVGMHHDGMHYFPMNAHEGGRRGVLALNHEYIDQTLLYPEGATPLTAEKVAKALAAHGVTVIEVRRVRGGGWEPVDSRYNRRITGTTPVTFSGPVGPDHPELAANNPPMGTLNNCANGYTPWGTYLTCEENWNGYFGTTDTTWKPSPLDARYGVTATGGYGWHTVEPRFDAAANPKELNRFGWVVEIDPFDPDSTPVKRTALGRVKHEGATVTERNGRVVVYTGDDENGDYVYKFVGGAPWRALRARGRSPLDHGTLHVARFAADGTGTWVPLVWGEGVLTAANGWMDQADVLLRTRQAADAVGATKCDRPEWIAVHPDTGGVYITFTNGTQGAAGPNPRAGNIYGHIVHLDEDDSSATAFAWDVFAFAGDPGYQPEGQFVPADQPLFGSPDGLWIDPDGRMWIQTDISNSSQNLASRKHDHIGNNAMLAADPATGEIRRFLTGPRGAEITGIAMAPDQRTLFVNVQHPGESTPAWGAPTPANPRAVSNWPDFDPAGRPRPATVAITKDDGGRIGT